MPNCPHCNSIYFGNPDTCPECRYNFALRRVVSAEELRRQRDEAQAQREAALKEKQEMQRQEAQRQHEIQQNRLSVLMKNPRYEYRTELVADSRDGIPDVEKLNGVLERYAREGWRLHTAMTNEAGRNSSSTGVGGVSIGTNATVDVTILIFERCIKPADF